MSYSIISCHVESLTRQIELNESVPQDLQIDWLQDHTICPLCYEMLDVRRKGITCISKGKRERQMGG
jgi:hypothetical protein